MNEDELRKNTLLRDLPAPEYDLLRERLEIIDAERRHQVYSPRSPISSVYFPLTSVYSLVAMVDERVVIEVGTIGYEGMVGLPLFLGTPTSPNAAYCQIPGRAAQLSAADFGDVLGKDGTLHRRLHRFAQTTMVQLSQNVACNHGHPTDQRAARWLLTSADRVRSDSFHLTQDFLGQMLGVRRSTVSEVASKLQADGLINYVRGDVTLTDRQGLEGMACPCYFILRQEFEELAADEQE